LVPLVSTSGLGERLAIIPPESRHALAAFVFRDPDIPFPDKAPGARRPSQKKASYAPLRIRFRRDLRPLDAAAPAGAETRPSQACAGREMTMLGR